MKNNKDASKSVLNTLDTGYSHPIERVLENKIKLIQGKESTFNTGFEGIKLTEKKLTIIQNIIPNVYKTQDISKCNKEKINIYKPPQEQEDIKYNTIINQYNTDLLELSIGYDVKIDLIPLKPPYHYCQDIQKNRPEDSIIEEVETGFGECNKAYLDCKTKTYKVCLFKENYLSEFKTEIEKQIARNNLGVYSKKEIDDILEKIVSENKDYITKTEVEKMLDELDFVDSILKSNANYEIPEDLFKI